MGEMNYYEVLGVEPGGEKGSEVAEPTETITENTDAGNNISTADTDPVSQEKREPDGGGESGGGGDDPSDRERLDPVEDEEAKRDARPQSKEDNARFAAARRKAEAERDAEIARVREEAKQFADKKIADVLHTMNLQNPYTGAPIRTMDEYEAYQKKLFEEQKNSVMESSGMSEEQFAEFMQSRPEVQEAKRAKEEAEAVIRAAREREVRAKIDEQIKEITAQNPAIQSLSDLTKLESYPEIYEKVKRGYTIADAYKLTNLADIETRAAQRARQETRNAERSKNHLEKTQTRGMGSVEVPADVKAQYRMFYPDMTEAEIQKHYAGYARHSS